MEQKPSAMKEFEERSKRLSALIDSDPKEAINQARCLRVEGVHPANIEMVTAGTLVDAGRAARAVDAVNEGILIFESLRARFPEKVDLAYNLANGLMARAHLSWTRYPDWYLDTLDDRTQARHLFGIVATSEEAEVVLRTQAYTNLGNALSDAYRFNEAYDHYLRALDLDPTNGTAHVHAANVLIKSARRGVTDVDAVLAVASQHIKNAKLHPDRIRAFVGETGLKRMSDTLNLELPPADPPDLSLATDYQRFIASHRLFLADTIDGLDLSMARWDSLRLDGISDGPDAVKGVPPLFAMFNVLKADYLAARHIAYLALSSDVAESGNYSDTLDTARYGVVPALLTLAQRACLDVLDKIAVLSSAYLGVPGDPERIYFRSTWFEKGQKPAPLRWKETIHKELEAGNSALVAISELSRDIQDGGFLEHKREMRHASTHRFTVLHQTDTDSSRFSDYIDRYRLDYFVRHLIETLQMSRSAIIYTTHMIALHESIHDDGSPRMSLEVPDHDV